MNLSEIKTETIDGAEVVAVASTDAIGKPIAYALTIRAISPLAIFKIYGAKVRYLAQSHLLGAAGWETETGGLSLMCETKEEALSHIPEWLKDFRDHGYVAEAR